MGSFRAYEVRDLLNRHLFSVGDRTNSGAKADIWLRECAAMDTNTLLIILLVIFLCGGFGYYGRGRWY